MLPHKDGTCHRTCDKREVHQVQWCSAYMQCFLLCRQLLILALQCLQSSPASLETLAIAWVQVCIQFIVHEVIGTVVSYVIQAK